MPSVTLRLLPGKRTFPRFDSGGRPLPGLEPGVDYEISAPTEAALWHKLLPYQFHCEIVEGELPPMPKPESPSLGRFVKAALSPQAPEEKPQLADLFTCPHCATQPFRDARGLARHLMRAHPGEYRDLNPFALNAEGRPSNDLSPWLALVEGTAPALEEAPPAEEEEEVVGGLGDAPNPIRVAIVDALSTLGEGRKKGIVSSVAERLEVDADAVTVEFEAMIGEDLIESSGRWEYRLKQ